MKHEPESVRDMEWAEKQISSFSIDIDYKNAGNCPSEGALADTCTEIYADRYNNVVKIRRKREYYDKRLDIGWSIRTEREQLAVLSFEEFKYSEWWGPYLKKMKNVNFDSSWMDSFEVDAEKNYAEITFEVPEREKVWWCSSEVPTGHTVGCTVSIYSDGSLYLQYGMEKEDAEVSEFIQAMKKLREFERAGVSLDDDGNVLVKRQTNKLVGE